MRWDNDEFWMTDEIQWLDVAAITRWLQSTYWAAQRTRETIELSLRHSLNFGMFQGQEPMGFARVISDYATHGYLCDVFIAPEYRRRGLGKWMLQTIFEHPRLQGVRMDLFTKDAQDFYRQLGFGKHRFDCLVRYPAHYAGGSSFVQTSQAP